MDSEARKRTRANSFDVAELAGVSQSTVSRALSGSSAITEATRERVLAAARELDYHVDERAARLRRGKSGVIALVVICREGELAEGVNGFSQRLLSSVCAAASARGYETLVSLQSDEEKFYGHYVETGQADAMVVIGTTTNRSAWDFFTSVGGGRRAAFWGAPHADVTAVRSNNREGGALAARHLLAQGYRRIAFIGAEDDTQRQFAARCEGLRDALAAEGLEPLSASVSQTGNREAQGREGVAELVASGEPFDAIFAACDDIALGVLAELEARGIAVPGDVGVIGFDGAPTGEYAHPPLASIAPDIGKAGQLLVEAALDGADGASTTKVPVHLVERRSATRSA